MELGTRRQINMIERADTGLRSFLNKVYAYMAGSLVLSALTAYLAIQPAVLKILYQFDAATQSMSPSVWGWIVLLSPLALIFFFNGAIRTGNAQKAGFIFWMFAALMGLSLGNIFLIYTAASIAQTFLVTAGAFLALSIYGQTTQRDLSGLGSFLFMGLIGVILATLANLFFKSSMFECVTSVIGTFLFAGFTIYDTNNLKKMYEMSDSENTRQTLAISGALSLYLDIINLFHYLLRFLGERR